MMLLNISYLENFIKLYFRGYFGDERTGCIMTSGKSVGPFEVESKLLEHPDVVEAVVIGKPDLLRGEIVTAYVVLKEGLKPTEEIVENIRMFVNDSLAEKAAPSEIIFKDKFPKTRSGKIMRSVLKSWELNTPAGNYPTSED